MLPGLRPYIRHHPDPYPLMIREALRAVGILFIVLAVVVLLYGAMYVLVP